MDALAKGQQLPMLLETVTQGRLRPNLITMTAALGACGPDSVGGGKGDRSLCADDAVSLCADDSFAMCADDSLSMCADDALTGGKGFARRL